MNISLLTLFLDFYYDFNFHRSSLLRPVANRVKLASIIGFCQRELLSGIMKVPRHWRCCWCCSASASGSEFAQRFLQILCLAKTTAASTRQMRRLGVREHSAFLQKSRFRRIQWLVFLAWVHLSMAQFFNVPASATSIFWLLVRACTFFEFSRVVSAAACLEISDRLQRRS